MGQTLGSKPAWVLLAAALVLVAGCAGPEDESESTDGTDDAASEACRTASGAGQNESGAQMLCQDASGAGTAAESFDCSVPERSAVRVATNMTAGSVTITLTGASGQTLFERAYDETGRTNDSAVIGEGEAGEWTLTGERSASFKGSFAAQAACAQEGSGGPGGGSSLVADPLASRG